MYEIPAAAMLQPGYGMDSTDNLIFWDKICYSLHLEFFWESKVWDF